MAPKGETQLTPEEKLLRAIFGEKAGDVKDASLTCPPGIEGTVVDVKVFTRKGIDKDQRAIEIEEAEIARMERDLGDEIRIIRDTLVSSVDKVASGMTLAADIKHPESNEKIGASGDSILRQEGWREAVERLEKDGKIAAWGVSVGDAEEARLAITAGANAICLTYNVLRAYDLEDLATEIATAGCGVLARSPLMFGLLAGQWSERKQFEDDDHRTRRWGLDAFTVRIRQIEDLNFLVGHEHHDLATAALRFVLTNTLVTTAIVGARTPKQIRHAAGVANGAPYVSDDDLARIAKVIG